MESQAKGSIKALEIWAKKVTRGYRDVDVRDMSASFRDGLAFCAIIHHYKPDLIDFDSLSKENILENNQMAFSVAEKQLGVPALLDAEDMVQYSRPDRLSIITYLSQLHNCFENQNKVKSGFKRLQNTIIGPPSKIIASSKGFPEPKLLSTRRIEVCQICNNRVFILERLIVDRKLYHTACFRCYKCKSLLNPGAYVESDIPGQYECSVCVPEEKFNSMDTDDTGSHSSLEEKSILQNSVPLPLHSVQNNIMLKSPLSESVSHARTNFLQHSLYKSNADNRVPLPKLEDVSPTSDGSVSPFVKDESLHNGVSVKDKISVFESSRRSSLNVLKEVEPSSSNKVVESSISSATPYLNTSLTKSPRPSIRLSLVLPAVSDTDGTAIQKASSEKLVNSTILDDNDSSSNCDSSIVLKNSSANLKATSSSSDSSKCDTVSSKLIASEVPATNSNTSIYNRSSLLRSLSKDTEKVNAKMFGEYKSPLKTSRDIFQNNIHPLNLTIPTINTSVKKEPASLPVTPITSPDFVNSSPEINQIKPTYTRTLTRPLSYNSLSSRDKPGETPDNHFSNVLHSKWSRITPRRNSLDHYIKNDGSNSITGDSLPAEINKIKSNDVTGVSNIAVSNTVSSPDNNKTPIPSLRKSLVSKELPKGVSEVKKEPELTSLKSSLICTSETSHNVSGKELPNHLLPPKDTTISSLSNSKVSVTLVPPKDEAVKSYPDDLNPFGEDEIEEEYPDDLNPFGDEEEETPKVFEGVSADNYDESKNPFASDEEDAGFLNTPSPRPPNSQTSSPFSTVSSLSSPTGSLRGTTKKRKAPKPPKLSDIFPNDAINSEADVSFNSLRPSSPAVSRKVIQTPSPKLRKNKPAPPPPPVPSSQKILQTDVTASLKRAKDADNIKLKSNASKEPAKESKKKKRPAPPVPIPMRKDKKKIPLKEIMREMKDIEIKQREFEKQGREIELLIRDRDKDEEASIEEEEYIMQLFELVNQKNALFRRQAELMYIKRSQRLEEQQEELEKQIRQLMEKPESEKSEEDKTKEEELIYELTDIVDQRNSIIDSIEMDRRRELEEDVSVQEHIEIKNGDLPIAAEIKEKSKGKVKKEKKKKEKKKEDKKKEEKKKDKHQENGESGKTTLRRKLFK